MLMHHYLQHDTSLADYTSGRYRQEAEELQRSGVEPSGLIERRYSSIADLEMTRLMAEIRRCQAHADANNLRSRHDIGRS